MKIRNFILPLAILAILSSCGTQEGSSQSSQSGSGGSTSGKVEMARTFQDYAENPFYNTSAVPLSGTPKVLVIPVWFSNSSTFITSNTYKNYVLEDIQTGFEGTEEETGWHSVKTYYETLSNGELSLQFTFADWYNCGYTYQSIGMSGSSNTLLLEAVEDYFSKNTDENRADYDYNSDGYIDGVMLIYAAPDYSHEGFTNYSNLWAYCYWVQEVEPNVNNPVANAYFWCSYDFMYDESNARSRTGSNYYYGDNDNTVIDTHTFIHEMGHVLGYDNDYYDYSYTCYPAGGFSMQDHNIGSHDPYTVMASGWADPYIPTESCTIEIGDFQSTHDLILLTPEWNSVDSPFDEYLLLELYTPTGLNQLDAENQYQDYPQGPTSTGIRLWHVDSRLTTSYNGGDSFTTSLFVDPLSASNGCLVAMSNTYYSNDPDSNQYITELGRQYADYNQLQLIRNNVNTTNEASFVRNSDLFGNNSVFSMSRFSKQFVNSSGSTPLLNSGKSLGWSFQVSISGSGEDATATITLYKE